MAKVRERKWSKMMRPELGKVYFGGYPNLRGTGARTKGRTQAEKMGGGGEVSPLRKGQQDYIDRLRAGKGGKSRDSQTFKKRGNTQISRTRSNKKIKGKNEKGESSFSSDVKVVESGPKRKYKVKSSNTPEEIKSGVGVPDSEHWDSERHLVSGKQESKSKRRKWTGENKDKRSKFKGKKGIAKLRKVKSDQPSYKKHYGDMLG